MQPDDILSSFSRQQLINALPEELPEVLQRDPVVWNEEQLQDILSATSNPSGRQGPGDHLPPFCCTKRPYVDCLIP